MYCKKCGKELKSGTQFCPECGMKLEQEKKPFSKIILIIAMLVILGIGYSVVTNSGILNSVKKEKEQEVKKAGIFSSNKYLAMVQNEEGKVGYINEKGEEVIPCQFDAVQAFEKEGVAVVAKHISNDEYEYGLINTKGESVTDEVYTYIGEFTKSGLAQVERKMGINAEGHEEIKKGFINKKGEEVIPCQYEDVSDFVNGYAWIYNGKYGYIDEKGKEIIKCQYEEAEPFDVSGVAIVKDSDWNSFCINTEGQVVLKDIDILSSSDIGEGKEKLYVKQEELVTEDEEYEYEDEDEESLQECEYYINDKGENVFGKKFASAECFYNGYATVRELIKYEDEEVVTYYEGQWAYINEDGEYITSYQFDFAENFDKNNRAVVYQIGEGELVGAGVIDTSGEFVLGCKYDGIESVGKGLWKCEKYILKDSAGEEAEEEVDSTLYDEANCEVALINESEKVIIPYRKGYIGQQGDNQWIVAGKYVSERSNGSLLYTCEYLDEKGDVMLTLPDTYVYAGEFKKVK